MGVLNIMIVFRKDTVIIPAIEYSAICGGFLYAHIIGVVEILGGVAIINGYHAVSGIVAVAMLPVVNNIAIGVVLVVGCN